MVEADSENDKDGKEDASQKAVHLHGREKGSGKEGS